MCIVRTPAAAEVEAWQRRRSTRFLLAQLVVDIGDAKTKKLMWMANSTDTLTDNPDEIQKKLNKTIQKMFNNFPPPPKK